MLIVLCGKMGSGKTTTAEALEARGFKRLITETTRPMRQGEIDGVFYHFLTEEAFMERKKAGYYAETYRADTIFGPWYYGSKKELYEDTGEDRVIVLNASGLKQIAETVDPANYVAIYLDVEEDLLLERLVKRGDNPNEIRRRLKDDERVFSDIEKYTDWQIQIKENVPVKRIAFQILRCIQQGERNESCVMHR